MSHDSKDPPGPVRLYRNYRYGQVDNWSTECDPGILNADHYVEFDGETLRIAGVMAVGSYNADYLEEIPVGVIRRLLGDTT